MDYHRKVPCEKENLKEIRVFVSDVLKKHKLPDVEVNAIVLAVDEVCANLIIHGHNCNPEESIELIIHVKKDKFIFDILDKGGEGFDISEYKAPPLTEIIKSKKKGGVGLILVKRIMDTIQLIKEGEHNIYRLTKVID